MINSFSEKYRFLSNFYPCFDSTLEHYYQAMKTLDNTWRKRILNAPTAGIAKRLGSKAPLRKDWDTIKISVMRNLVRDKFKYNRVLRAKLLETGNEELVEGNWWGDTYWGRCEGDGNNYLGIILMALRKKYREQEEVNE